MNSLFQCYSDMHMTVFVFSHATARQLVTCCSRMFVIDHLLSFLSSSTHFSPSSNMAGKSFAQKSTGGKAPRKELFGKCSAEVGATSATINVEMSSALVPATQVDFILLFRVLYCLISILELLLCLLERRRAL
jgi:hypothetical protein